ncbi:uncharacterized protein LOC131024649 [Salvia miltiorrhiza]|uniref:uncharacterized protein LOC131024649 n=1 Tax=Salvia miltiorrhiza TaxID=226208 RepID=UPI0025AC4319|nr:uncharacterized protein LOC131024649 [Salvia miltiorrhiza]XP_057810140.1 uncharacterized protein LOC131024649 [Salvia miltiorrhiza]
MDKTFGISHGSTRDDRARKLADRLLDATQNQLVLVPCNVDKHWILTVIQPFKDRVYLMDPLYHRNRDATWKSVVDTAMTIFNANKDKRQFKKAPSWEIVKGPVQPDSKLCGFYVMRFMKEIVKAFESDDSISLTKLFHKSEYSQCEIDEVREDWASCVIHEIDK